MRSFAAVQTATCKVMRPRRTVGIILVGVYRRLRADTPVFQDSAAFQVGNVGLAYSAPDPRLRLTRGMASTWPATFSALSEYPLFAGACSSTPTIAKTRYRLQWSDYAPDGRSAGRPIHGQRGYLLNGHPFTVVGIAPPGFVGANLLSAPRLTSGCCLRASRCLEAQRRGSRTRA